MKEMTRGKQVSRCSRPPARWRRELRGVLMGQPQIARQVRKLANEIERDFAGRDLVVVSLLNGTVMFLADLIRHLSLPMRLDVRGRDVLVVDDILDTGRTLKCVLDKLRELKPRRIKVCVLLEKKDRRVEKVRVDYVGFSIPDLFVVGYGLDFAERYRNLPFVGILHPQYYQIG